MVQRNGVRYGKEGIGPGVNLQPLGDNFFSDEGVNFASEGVDYGVG
jgi:hypothetical protein